MSEHSKECCPTCGGPVVEYRHTISRGLIEGLSKIAHKVRPLETVAIADLGLTYAQRCNFQKLQYWGFVRQAGHTSGRGGLWILTLRGADFLAGDLAVQRTAWTFRAQVVRFEGDEVTVDQVAEGYKYRPEYAAEAQPHSRQQLRLV